MREAAQRIFANLPSGGGAPMGALGLGAVGLTGLAYGSANCLFNVEGGHRAVMYHRFGGVQQRVRGEGTHLVLPWFQRPVLYDVRAKPRMIQSLTGSKVPFRRRTSRRRSLGCSSEPSRNRPPHRTCRWSTSRCASSRDPTCLH